MWMDFSHLWMNGAMNGSLPGRLQGLGQVDAGTAAAAAARAAEQARQAQSAAQKAVKAQATITQTTAPRQLQAAIGVPAPQPAADTSAGQPTAVQAAAARFFGGQAPQLPFFTGAAPAERAPSWINTAIIVLGAIAVGGMVYVAFFRDGK